MQHIHVFGEQGEVSYYTGLFDLTGAEWKMEVTASAPHSCHFLPSGVPSPLSSMGWTWGKLRIDWIQHKW